MRVSRRSGGWLGRFIELWAATGCRLGVWFVACHVIGWSTHVSRRGGRIRRPTVSNEVAPLSSRDAGDSNGAPLFRATPREHRALVRPVRNVCHFLSVSSVDRHSYLIAAVETADRLRQGSCATVVVRCQRQQQGAALPSNTPRIPRANPSGSACATSLRLHQSFDTHIHSRRSRGHTDRQQRRYAFVLVRCRKRRRGTALPSNAPQTVIGFSDPCLHSSGSTSTVETAYRPSATTLRLCRRATPKTTTGQSSPEPCPATYYRFYQNRRAYPPK